MGRFIPAVNRDICPESNSFIRPPACFSRVGARSACAWTASPLESNHRMTQQPNLFSPDKPSPAPLSTNSSPDPSPTPLADGRAPDPRRTPPWLQYIELSVRVVVRLYLGLVLLVLPWTPFWSNNRLLLFVPHLLPLVLNGVTRGIVSGLGLLNIWIGIHDAVHYKQG